MTRWIGGTLCLSQAGLENLKNEERANRAGDFWFLISQRDCNQGTTRHLMIFLTLTTVTLMGFAVGPALESNNLQLPLQAWYPYDWSKSPAYELTYLHQICAIYAAACLNVSKDMVVVSLLSQCRCRFKLLGYDLKTLCQDMCPGTMQRMSQAHDLMVQARLNECIREHQDILDSLNELQRCFSEPTFAQFTVSLVIICVTAFQLTKRACPSVNAEPNDALLPDRQAHCWGFYYSFSGFFNECTFIIIQATDLFIIWGDIQLMTASAFVLLTNLTHSLKILNMVVRADRIKSIVKKNYNVLKIQVTVEAKKAVKKCNREVNIQSMLYAFLTATTISLWALAAATENQNKQLPMRAWYPFNASQSPMYEIAYLHQAMSLMLSASMNASKDIVVMALIAQCRCRFRLISIALKGLCSDMHIVNNRLTKKQEDIVAFRLGNCIAEHQDNLETVNELERCFSEPTFAQFTVSLAIICVTGFQLVFQTGNVLRMLSMTFYLLNMVDQVYLYCREGNKLTIESENVSRSAYEWPWYTCSVPVRRSALILMTRCCRTAKLTAGGFTTLSLATFVSIFNVVLKRETIRTIVNDCEQELISEKRESGRKIIARFNRQARLQLFTYIALSAGTVVGWAASAQKNQLPLRAWYPYDTTQSPAYDLTYIHQCVAVGLAASVNISVDTVVTSLVALCCCRLQLLALSLQTLFEDLPLQTKGLLHPSVEPVAWVRLKECIQQHQTTLKATALVQRCFSLPVLAQFTVSVLIICATAYQLSFVNINKFIL
ncbi:unnamed protein product [Pieris brassicae]|uniref:Odorant receptor n=1 Tax=Pieris brassicae TaxID=7116 RepID=A0A9P0XA69_PIEBR|nr:unnamed protein product [Pieris brassicae]